MEATGQFNSIWIDYTEALKFNPLNMETISPRILPIIYFCMFLTLQITSVEMMLTLVTQKYNYSLVVVHAIFVALLSCFFSLAAGYLLQRVLAKENDTEYLTYVYVVAMSISYMPIVSIGFFLLPKFSLLFYIALSSIMQYYITSCMLSNTTFTNSRDYFVFNLVSVLLSITFFMCLFSIY